MLCSSIFTHICFASLRARWTRRGARQEVCFQDNRFGFISPIDATEKQFYGNTSRRDVIAFDNREWWRKEFGQGDIVAGHEGDIDARPQSAFDKSTQAADQKLIATRYDSCWLHR